MTPCHLATLEQVKYARCFYCIRIESTIYSQLFRNYTSDD